MNDTPDEAAKNGASAGADSAPKGQAETASANEQNLGQLLAAAKTENADLRDRLLRAMAEMENLRRRTEREKADSMKYAISEFARDAASIGDNLRRAIEAAQKGGLEENPALKNLIEGVEATERELFKVFERHGVTRFDPLGEKFDPHSHEAMVKVDVPNVPADVIVQVLQAGYKIGDRILRPAVVILAKGGTPTETRPEARTEEAEASQQSSETAAEHGGGVAAAHEHDPDVVRDTSGAPKAPRRERASGDKRASTVTRPVTEGSGAVKKDDLISSFGKRLENGS